MPRFIAFAWNDRDDESNARAAAMRETLIHTPAWTALTDRAGLGLYVPHGGNDSLPRISLPRDAGVILGTLFERSSSCAIALDRPTAISEHQSRAIAQTHGRSLIDSHWGSYVLFLRDPHEPRVRVLRGPTGTLPCYYSLHESLTILVCNAADLLWLIPGRLSINWDSIRAQAAAGDYLTRETGLMNVTAIVSGECIDIHEGRITHHTYWSPADACSDPIETLREATTVLRQETQRCVAAWATQHERLLLLLSGGLDSSIVLSCLHRAPTRPTVTAVNFYSPGAGDERRFARSMTALTQTPIEEVASNVHIDLRDFQRCALTPSPGLNFTAFDVEPVVRRLAQRWQATALFTGEIGDDALGHAPMPEALAEILQRPRALHRFFSASLDYAELMRISVWRAMRLALQSLSASHRAEISSVYRHRRRADPARSGSLISDTAADHYETMIGRFVHPWFKAADHLPLGKTMLLHSLIKATSSLSHSTFDETDTLPILHPLMSQPLIEASLRTPSHLHFHRSENGAVARTAFREALSSEVLARGTGKGTPAAWTRSLLDENSAFLSTLLLEGALVQRNILDRRKVEGVLAKELSRTRVGMAELIRQVYIELWLRRWAEAGARL